MIRVLLFGGRDFTNWGIFSSRVDYYLQHLDQTQIEIVSGGCDKGLTTFTRSNGKEICGADGLAERYAALRGHQLTKIDPDWKQYGRSAGPIRNSNMAIYTKGHYAIGFWDGFSRGTYDMMCKADQVCKLKMVDYYGNVIPIPSLSNTR